MGNEESQADPTNEVPSEDIYTPHFTDPEAQRQYDERMAEGGIRLERKRLHGRRVFKPGEEVVVESGDTDVKHFSMSNMYDGRHDKARAFSTNKNKPIDKSCVEKTSLAYNAVDRAIDKIIEICNKSYMTDFNAVETLSDDQILNILYSVGLTRFQNNHEGVNGFFFVDDPHVSAIRFASVWQILEVEWASYMAGDADRINLVWKIVTQLVNIDFQPCWTSNKMSIVFNMSKFWLRDSKQIFPLDSAESIKILSDEIVPIFDTCPHLFIIPISIAQTASGHANSIIVETVIQQDGKRLFNLYPYDPHGKVTKELTAASKAIGKILVNHQRAKNPSRTYKFHVYNVLSSHGIQNYANDQNGYCTAFVLFIVLIVIAAWTFMKQHNVQTSIQHWGKCVENVLVNRFTNAQMMLVVAGFVKGIGTHTADLMRLHKIDALGEPTSYNDDDSDHSESDVDSDGDTEQFTKSQLSAMKVVELRNIAKGFGIKYSKLRKQELVEQILLSQ